MRNGPYAGGNQPTDPDVVHTSTNQHSPVVSAPCHGVPHSASEETEEGGRSKNKGGEVLRRSRDLWKVVEEPDHPGYKVGMDVHWATRF